MCELSHGDVSANTSARRPPGLGPPGCAPVQRFALAVSRSAPQGRTLRRRRSRDGCEADVYARPHVRHGPKATILALLALLTGCGGWKGNTYYAHRVPAERARREATYAFGTPSDDWREVRDAEGVQVAWVKPAIAGAIEIHAQCAEHGDSSLFEYTDHLRIDWTEWDILEQREERMLGRAALRTVVDASIDGVARRNELLVLKKDGCLFDLRYSATPEEFARGRPAFERVVTGFRFPL